MATILFLVAITFHGSVYHRFGVMENKLQEAADIKWAMGFDEMKALSNYFESLQLHRRGIRDTMLAYEYAEDADSLREYVLDKKNNVLRLKEDAKEKTKAAQVDKQMSDTYAVNSFQANRAYVASTVTGIDLAQQAEEENERSANMMKKASEQEDEEKKRLKEAQVALEMTETVQYHAKIDKGICKWAFVVCNMINGNGGNAAYEDRNQIHQFPIVPSDAVIKANKDIHDALLEIHNTEIERAKAIELHKDASIRANLSRAVLGDIQEFKNQSDIYLHDSEEFRSSAVEKEAEAEKDDEKAQLEETDIATKEYEIIHDVNNSETIFERVIEDHYKEQIAMERVKHYRALVQQKSDEWKEKEKEATNHVARAGWEAIVASVAGSCLLVVVITRIVATFRYRQPLRWVLRDMPYFSQDLLYLVCHIWIFLLAMGYVGELLMTFHYHNFFARMRITIIFAFNAAILQVILLHLIPSMCILFREPEVEARTVRLLVKQVIMKKGVIILLVSAIEMLLCWCWIATVAFERVHLVNTYAVWLAVLCISASYGIFVQKNNYAVADDLLTYYGDISEVLYPTSNSDGESGKENERLSLLSMPYQERSHESLSESAEGFFMGSPNKSPIQNSKVSAESSTSMQSIPIGSTESKNKVEYESLTNSFRARLSTSPVNFSWKSELEKVRLLFELLIASVAIWIVRRDLSLIRKLSPLAKDVIWGRAPLWILNIFLFIAFATFVVAFANTKFGQ